MINKKLISDFSDIIGNLTIAIHLKSLEDVKEILGALDLGIKGTSKIMSTNGHDMDKLSKYLK